MTQRLGARPIEGCVPGSLVISSTVEIEASKGELKILIPSVVVAELVWVLESFYKLAAAEITELVESILNTPGVDIQDKSIIKAALKIYRSKEIDLVDAWIIEFAKAKGAKRIYTFDKKHFKDLREIEIISP